MIDPSRVLIATPIDGNHKTAHVTYAYHSGVRALERSGSVVLPSELCFQDDISRARSRCVWYALHKIKAFDWLLFWDDDVAVPDATIVPRMIERARADGHHWIGAPYPRKRIPSMFPYIPLAEQVSNGRLEIKNDCIEVEALAIGFTLISRETLEAMENWYREDDWWAEQDDSTGEWREVVGIFKQVHTPTIVVPDGKGGTRRRRDLYSEDYSACTKWRAMGGKVQMYVGEGTPLAHVGSHPFIAERSEIGQFR